MALLLKNHHIYVVNRLMAQVVNCWLEFLGVVDWHPRSLSMRKLSLPAKKDVIDKCLMLCFNMNLCEDLALIALNTTPIFLKGKCRRIIILLHLTVCNTTMLLVTVFSFSAWPSRSW